MSKQKFRTILADPAWLMRDKLPGPKRGSVKHYKCLSLDEIKNFPLPPIADDALLFLWSLAPMKQEALDVAQAWGFVPKSEIVWVKTRPCRRCKESGVARVLFGGRFRKMLCPKCRGKGWNLHFGMGRYVRNCHETLLIARRGKAKVLDRAIRSTLFAHVGRHSSKPDEVFPLVQKLSPGPYVELFARKRRKGWTTIGDEIPKEHP